MIKKPRIQYLPEKLVYSFDIVKGAAIGGLIGWGAGVFSDAMHNTIIPEAAKVDEKVGEVMVEKGGKAGETVIGVDKKVADVWDRVLGRTPEEKKAWREEHGIKEPKYLEQVDDKPRTQEQPPALQPSHYTSSWLALGLGIGAAYGALKGLGNYVRGKRERDLITATQENSRLLRISRDLESEVADDDQDYGM
ncbi:MAG TPA: hypothetical protein VJB87_05560 [Candidatus Nanoarchaeia archaeon]|nr:hypothetical protein [Candidatus Nanoarchaeia archaeon]